MVVPLSPWWCCYWGHGGGAAGAMVMLEAEAMVMLEAGDGAERRRLVCLHLVSPFAR